jgi:hypothetical protein
MVHETSKSMCLQFEFQGDKEDIENDILTKALGEDYDFDYIRNEEETLTDYCRRKTAYNEYIRNVQYDYMWGDEKKDCWCAKCLLFARGFYDNPLVVGHQHIHHSYSNPYWESDWNIKSMYLGSSFTPFIKLFRNDNMYREITKNDIDSALEHIEQLGKPLRNSDKEAYEETMEVLGFLQTWSNDESVYMIMEDEC